MDLHGIVSGAIASVNPFISAQLKVCTGFSQAASSKRTATYADAVTISIQKQRLTFKDLQHIDGLNLQGQVTAVWSEGSLKAVDRVTQTGGDLLDFNGQEWLVVSVPEQWPDWCHAVLCLQGATT